MLSLFKAMNSGGHDARSGIETAGHADASCVLRKIDFLQRNGAGRRIDNPNEAFAVLGQNGRCGHARNWALVGGKSCSDGRSKPEARRRIVQRNTDALRARDRIGLRRDLANFALNLNGGQKSASRP